AGVLRTLAEPNLTAISGESASFLAGGEFPVPGGFVCDSTTHNCQIEVQFKKFGVGLNFTPVVLSGGRISLKVMSEVSEVTSDNELILQQAVSAGQSASVTIPGIKTRRAETTVEIPSGGSLAMAGMIQEQTKQQINGLPGLMQLPILGALFKSRDFINNTTELMVIVTPYVVHPVARRDLSLPDDGFADASDPATILLGRLNRIYGSAGHVEPHGGYFGQYGFIIDWRRTGGDMRKIAAARHRLIDTGRALAVLGLGVTLAGCLLDQDALTANQATDVRQRHPMAIREGEHTVNLLIGVDRGGLLPAQRAE